MGDSDDEYDRRRRDKFRRERSDYDRSRERDERRRGDDWNDREWDRGRDRRSRGEYRDYDRNRRERFSPPRHELSPPQKRMRRDWDEHSSDPYHSGYEMPYAGGGGGPTYGPPQPWGHPDVHIMQHHVLPIQARLGSIAEIDLGVPPPVMKTFKEFLLSLDDSVDETEAVKRYNDYKLEFRRQQMQDFFLAHKDEECTVGMTASMKGSVSESESEPESVRAEEEKDEAEEAAKEKEKPKEEEREKPKEKPKETLGLEFKPRPLHKTCSLFMRNIAPNIPRAEIISLCKKYPGFMRVALSEPQPERRFFRRGWVTFDRSVNIKEICWNLQNIRLRECELSPGVNRDLTRRVRNVNGITQHKQIVRNDIKLAAKLIHTLDDRTQLWGAESGTPPLPTSLPSQNPILKNITDYLIEEVSAEEEELLGNSGGGGPPEEPPKEGNPAEINVERDEKLLKVLDKLLLYLRIVHSLDYYNTCEYPNEDEMPNRCGIIHVRGPVPPNRISHGEVVEWQKTFEEKLTPLLSVRESLSEDEAQKMGRKDPEQEVEKFVTSNTQELGKDKWLCPLSGKKFKGPEFVRKHIFNKHAEKIEEVKKEVAFFNNFLTDAKRPALPEVKPAQPPGPAQSKKILRSRYPTPQGLMPYGQPRPPILGYGAAAVRPTVPTGGPPYGGPHAPYGAGRGNYDSFRGQGGYPGKPRNRMVRGDPRAIVEYRDLDAPEDVDFF
uniref:Serrate RNA effector molecule homolog n=1 Tax=Monodelphis domestica TaxID=13616 RepID=A0A5F8G9W8_MONDO